MSARKRTISGPKVAGPTVSVNTSSLFDVLDEDWYTPRVLRVRPIEVIATLGKKGDGKVRCQIEEDGWERKSFTLAVMFDERPAAECMVGDIHSSISNEHGEGFAATLTSKDLDNLIDALTAARDRARELGLFKARPTPKTLRDAFPEHFNVPKIARKAS